MRQTCKQILTIWLFLGHFLGIFAGMVPAVAAGGIFSSPNDHVRGSTLIRPPNRKIVTDPLSGIALFGYDPITYFTRPQPLVGNSDFEYDWQGVTWRFVNAANAAIFARTPNVYAPVYGGYGVTALSRGYFSDGNPRLFTFHRKRLFLFVSVGNREVFLLDQTRTNRRAASGWDQIFVSKR